MSTYRLLKLATLVAMLLVSSGPMRSAAAPEPLAAPGDVELADSAQAGGWNVVTVESATGLKTITVTAQNATWDW
jgi:hypothetical protein